MLSKLSRLFVRGLLTLAPIGVTLGIVFWIVHVFEALFAFYFLHIFGPGYYFPGIGIILGILLILFVGSLLDTWIMKRVFQAWDALFTKIPLVKTLYRSVGDMLNFFNTDKATKVNRVCIVRVDGKKILGLITRDEFEDLPESVGHKEEVCVYIPMSYQIGGFTIVVNRSEVELVDLSVEQAMRFLITAGAAKK